jgi:hypothetical protein
LFNQWKAIFVLALFGAGGYLLYDGIVRVINWVTDLRRNMDPANAERKPREMKLPQLEEIKFLETEQKSQ